MYFRIVTLNELRVPPGNHLEALSQIERIIEADRNNLPRQERERIAGILNKIARDEDIFRDTIRSLQKLFQRLDAVDAHHYQELKERLAKAMHSEKIRELPKAMGLTQNQFAAKLGVSFAAVNRWEKGRNTPQPDRLLRIQELQAEYLTAAEAGKLSATVRELPAQLDFEGDPDAVKLVVDAFRLRNGHLFNKAYGLELSRVVPLPHQRIAVYENLIPLSPLRFLLADDAGAGKTIMAGLYILEMLNRGRIQRVLICCPAGSVYNWQRELRFFFELNFTILRGANFRDREQLTDADPALIIMSVDTAAVPHVKESLFRPTLGSH